MSPHRARWRRSRPSAVVIDGGGKEPVTVRVEPPGDRPAPGLLRGKGWHAYPGSEWREDETGEWTVAVYPGPDDPLPAGG